MYISMYAVHVVHIYIILIRPRMLVKVLVYSLYLMIDGQSDGDNEGTVYI